MAPVGPLTLLHNGFRPTKCCCRLHALCSSASSSCSAHATMGSTLHVEIGSHSCTASRHVLAWQAQPYRSPKGCYSCWRYSLASHIVQPARHETRLGNFARDRSILPVQLDLGHHLLDSGQPSVLRLVLSRCSYPGGRPCAGCASARPL